MLKKGSDLKCIYLTSLSIKYSRSAVSYQASKGFTKFETFKISQSKRGLLLDLIKICSLNRKNRVVYFIMSPCHLLSIFIRLFTRKTIILDAGWSLYESTKTRNSKFYLLFKSYLIDFLAFHLSDLVLLESEAQIAFCHKTFFVSKRKMMRVFTGFNENQIFANAEITKKTHISSNAKSIIKKSNQRPIILFRGTYNIESGLESLLLCADKLVDKYNFILLTKGLPENLAIPRNVDVISHFMPWKDIYEYYMNASLVVGQVSNNLRLQNTIPHKAFEAAYFGKPYLTRDTPSMREIFPTEKEVYFYSSDNPTKLAILIEDILLHDDDLNQHGIKIRERYNKVCSQSRIQEQVLKIINDSI